MSLNRLRISLKRVPALEVNRIAISDLKLVYIICANRKIQYPTGRSPVVYIGTTKNGISRVAESAAFHSESILSLHGVNSFAVRVVTCRVRRGVRTWRKLEDAFLLAFRDMYGAAPYCNSTGTGYVETNEYDVFARKRVKDILYGLAETGVVPDRSISA
jgi:hypothetical protein